MAARKPTAPGTVDLDDVDGKTPEYFKANTGRVFVATAPLVKQWKKGKFGLIEISKKEYDEAMKAESEA